MTAERNTPSINVDCKYERPVTFKIHIFGNFLPSVLYHSLFYINKAILVIYLRNVYHAPPTRVASLLVSSF